MGFSLNVSHNSGSSGSGSDAPSPTDMRDGLNSGDSASPSDVDIQLARAAANNRVQSFFNKGHGVDAMNQIQLDLLTPKRIDDKSKKEAEERLETKQRKS